MEVCSMSYVPIIFDCLRLVLPLIFELMPKQRKPIPIGEPPLQEGQTMVFKELVLDIH